MSVTQTLLSSAGIPIEVVRACFGNCGRRLWRRSQLAAVPHCSQKRVDLGKTKIQPVRTQECGQLFVVDSLLREAAAAQGRRL